MKSKQREAPRSMKTSMARQKRVAARRTAAGRVGAVQAAAILGRTPNTAPVASRVPTKWRWHHRVLLVLQSRLLRERGELLRASAEPIEPHSMDEADSATDEFDHDLALTQLSAEQNALYEVNGALARILSGSYGVCEETGQAIPEARLRAIPWARFTHAVEERLEKKGMVPQARLNKAATVRGKGRIWLAPEEEAEEVGESPPAPPKDEALTRVFSPPGRPAARHRRPPPPKAPKRQGRRN